MNTPSIAKSVKILRQKFAQTLGLPFQELLPSEVIQEYLAQLNVKYRQRLFDPICTLWAFLSQVLDVDKSCHNAVSRVIAYLVGSGDGTLQRTLQGHNESVLNVSFSPDGQTIASASQDHTIKLWELDGTLLHTLIGHTGIVNSISFSLDGKTIASDSDDKTVRLWSLDGRLLKTLQGHTQGVYSVSFSPQNQLLASAGRDGVVILWDLDLDSLTKRACDWVGDYLKTNPHGESDRYLCN